MLLNLNKLIDSEIFISHHILEKYFQSRVNSFVIFEEIAEDDGFTPCSLIFFPKNSGGKVTFEYLARLNALTCYGVFFEDDNEICKIRQWASQLKFPILELSSRITISQAIEQCYGRPKFHGRDRPNASGFYQQIAIFTSRSFQR